MNITPEKLRQLLMDKTIKAIEYYSYLDCDMCISTITFTDGSSIDLSGNADEARIDSYRDSDSSEELYPKLDK